MPPDRSLLLQFMQFFLQYRDAPGDIAPVELDLLLAGAAGLAQAAALALQVGPAAHQARRQVLQLRQLHLQLAFAGLGALREDAQDQLGAVEHLAAEFLLQVALLARRQRVVEDHRRGVDGVGLAADLLDLAAAGEQFRIRPRAPAAHHLRAARARAHGQAHGFGDALFVVPARRNPGRREPRQPRRRPCAELRLACRANRRSR